MCGALWSWLIMPLILTAWRTSQLHVSMMICTSWPISNIRSMKPSLGSFSKLDVMRRCSWIRIPSVRLVFQPVIAKRYSIKCTHGGPIKRNVTYCLRWHQLFPHIIPLWRFLKRCIVFCFALQSLSTVYMLFCSSSRLLWLPALSIIREISMVTRLVLSWPFCFPCRGVYMVLSLM